MNGFIQDLRYAARQMGKNPGFSAIAIGTLALGIGASTAIFSVVYGVLLRSLPYHKPDRIVQLSEVNSDGYQMRFDDPNFEDMRDQSRSFESMAQMNSIESAVSVGKEPSRTSVARVSKEFFSVMGVRPVIGRLFVPEEQQFGAAPVVLVSYSFWKTRLQETHDLSTAKVLVSNAPVAVIGVLPDGFAFPYDSQYGNLAKLQVLAFQAAARTAITWSRACEMAYLSGKPAQMLPQLPTACTSNTAPGT